MKWLTGPTYVLLVNKILHECLRLPGEDIGQMRVAKIDGSWPAYWNTLVQPLHNLTGVSI